MLIANCIIQENKSDLFVSWLPCILPSDISEGNQLILAVDIAFNTRYLKCVVVHAGKEKKKHTSHILIALGVYSILTCEKISYSKPPV